MGLLDNVLGELAGRSGAAGSASPIQGVLMSLLANQGGQGGGGIAGALGGILGGGGQAPMGGAAAGAAGGAAGGGLAGLIGQFEQAGLGHLTQSWVGNGANQPVSPQQVEGALGASQVQSMADQTGMPKQDLLSQLAQALPGVVDRLTPNGRVPSAQELQGGAPANTIEV